MSLNSEAFIAWFLLESLEQLEQLRALHHGMTILVERVEGEGAVAVDTPADLERVRTLISADSLQTNL